jgi:hypothetical protein
VNKLFPLKSRSTIEQNYKRASACNSSTCFCNAQALSHFDYKAPSKILLCIHPTFTNFLPIWGDIWFRPATMPPALLADSTSQSKPLEQPTLVSIFTTCKVAKSSTSRTAVQNSTALEHTRSRQGISHLQSPASLASPSKLCKRPTLPSISTTSESAKC